MSTTKRVVMYSGGVGSWAAAKRVAQRHGVSNMVLLFTDTLIEDEDLYRFLEESAANVGAPLVRIAEGRTPWQVFFDTRLLGNALFDPCSRILKREMADRWLRENCDPSSTVVYVGIDWTEEHRYVGLSARRAADGWRYDAPMCEPPLIFGKQQVFDWCRSEGIRIPRLYELGFSHNNCGGFCIKAGQGHYKRLLHFLPHVYAHHEQKEQEFIRFIGKPVSILTDRSGDGKKKLLTLKEFRERIEGGAQIDAFDVGGCGCFVEEAPHENHA